MKTRRLVKIFRQKYSLRYKLNITFFFLMFLLAQAREAALDDEQIECEAGAHV